MGFFACFMLVLVGVGILVAAAVLRWLVVGLLYFRSFKRALSSAGAAIRDNPNSTRLYLARGMLYYVARDYQNALADCNDAIRLDPTDADACGFRGGVLLATQEYEKAAVDFGEAIRLYPQEHAYAWFHHRGCVWLYTKEFDKAIADFTEAIHRKPTYAEAFNNRGLAWAHNDDLERAISDFDEAIRLESGVSVAFVNRGDALYAKGEFEKAFADYDRAIQLDPGYSTAYNQRAWLLATCPDPTFRDGNLAKASSKRACKMASWQEPLFLSTLAAAHAACGEFEQAIQRQQQAIGLESDATVKKVLTYRLSLFRAGKPCGQESSQRGLFRLDVVARTPVFRS